MPISKFRKIQSKMVSNVGRHQLTEESQETRTTWGQYMYGLLPYVFRSGWIVLFNGYFQMFVLISISLVETHADVPSSSS